MELFDPKQHDPCAPPFLFTQSCPRDIFFFCSPDGKKGPYREHFADVEEVK